MLTALAAGAATITATKNGLTAEATLTVLAGTSLPEGTTRWRVASTLGRSIGAPIYTHRVDATVPDLFIVEWDEIGAITVRAASAAGEVPWSAASPGWPLMGDAFGGLIAGVNFSYAANGERYGRSTFQSLGCRKRFRPCSQDGGSLSHLCRDVGRLRVCRVRH